ncbi:MAG: hypothetical protein R3B06_19415 [Kofleriaceae bacterium]
MPAERPQRASAPPPPPPPPSSPRPRDTSPPPIAASPASPAPVVAPAPSLVIGRADTIADGVDERDDATRVDPRGDATVAAAATRAPGGGLPVRARFERRAGPSGDVGYVFTVARRRPATRRELRRVEAALVGHRADRARHLIALGADAVAEPTLDSPELDAARDALAALEEERAARAGQAAAADADASAIRRSEKGEIARQTEAAAALEAAVAALTARLAPLAKDAQAVRRRGDELKALLARQDDQLRGLEARLVSTRGKVDRSAIEAELATLRADRAAVAADEPALAAQLELLAPQIASLEAERATAQADLAAARTAVAAASERAADELGAVAASRRVIARGVAELEKQRDRALREVGERLAIERPATLAPALARLDEVDLTIATAERRALELRELLATVDRRALARGAAILVAIAAALAAVAWLVLGR